MRNPILGFLILAAVAASASAQATLTNMGGNAPRPQSMTPDGMWITGVDFNGGFRWSSGSGFEAITMGFNGTPDVALGGSPVSATFVNLNGDEEAGQWTPSGVTLLGGIGGQSGTSISSVYGCNNDGSAVVGLGWVNAGQAHAFKWTQSTGMVDLLAQNPNRSSRANGISGDGTLVVGWDEDITGPRRAAIWPGGVPTWISANPGEAYAANKDGSVVVGTDNGNCFRWTQSGGLVDLGKLPNSLGGDDAVGLSVSDDGNTIVGFNGNAFFGTPFRAFIWRPGAGMVVLEDLLVALGAANAAGTGLSQASEVSADGKTIAAISGQIFLAPFKGWVATLPVVATIYCTAQVNSQGCTPAISFDGTPSASSGGRFLLKASNLVDNVDGILFYGTSGPDSMPYSGGTLCVASRVKRTPVKNSGGSGACTGALSVDFNAYVPVSNDPGLVGGAKVWAQFWSRDPQSPAGTNLTNAVEFTLWP